MLAPSNRPCGAPADGPFRRWPSTLDKVSFGTNWVAEAEHGGFYQAVADGTYAKYGLEVTIVPGGPQVNNRLLLLSKQDRFLHERELAAGRSTRWRTTSRPLRSRRCSRKTRRCS